MRVVAVAVAVASTFAAPAAFASAQSNAGKYVRKKIVDGRPESIVREGNKLTFHFKDKTTTVDIVRSLDTPKGEIVVTPTMVYNFRSGQIVSRPIDNLTFHDTAPRDHLLLNPKEYQEAAVEGGKVFIRTDGAVYFDPAQKSRGSEFHELIPIAWDLLHTPSKDSDEVYIVPKEPPKKVEASNESQKKAATDKPAMKPSGKYRSDGTLVGEPSRAELEAQKNQSTTSASRDTAQSSSGTTTAQTKKRQKLVFTSEGKEKLVDIE